MRASRDLKWEDKMYKLKRSIEDENFLDVNAREHCRNAGRRINIIILETKRTSAGGGEFRWH